ncbi:serine/Arginine-related protein 53-like, partial [Triplophysa dalaica]|uniref:serine/Arginine-related protein 53-like n=1 Tax=Triplophysa dalaica TaxID=1582913 RepID=UPI0024DFCD94
SHSCHRRSRSHSRNRDHSQRKTREKDRTRDKNRDKGREAEKVKEKEKHRDKGSNKAGLEHLTPAEHAKSRLQLVLQAAAKADEVLKAKEKVDEQKKIKEEVEEVTLAEQVRRIKNIEAIESDSFVPQAFKSSRDTVKAAEMSEIKSESETAAVKETTSLPTSITYNDSDGLAHPSLFLDKEQAEKMWVSRLISLRHERLMGSPVP